MKEVERSNDPVRLSWLQAVLEEAGIASVVLDGHTSILEGSLGILPRRVMVEDAAHAAAVTAIAAAEPGGPRRADGDG